MTLGVAHEEVSEVRLIFTKDFPRESWLSDHVKANALVSFLA